MLGISIFVHELGHLLCGMLVGVKARVFSLGYGRGIWKKRINQTTYQITAIPIGGYVLFRGDDYNKKLKGRKGELLSTPPLKRMIPVLGGPLFNLILGFLLFFFIVLAGDVTPSNKIFIDRSIQDHSAAYRSGLRTGDVILSINGKKVENFEDIFLIVGLSAGEPLDIEYIRENEKKKVSVTPDIFSAGGRPTLGIEPSGRRNVEVSFTYGEQIRHYFKTLFQSKIDSDVQLPESERSKKHRTQKMAESELKSKAIEYLKDGDVILEIEGKPVSTVGELQRTLGEHQNKVVNIKVDRKSYPLLSPWAYQTINVQVPVRASDIIEFGTLEDKQFSELNIRGLNFLAHDPKVETKISNIKIDDKNFKNFAELKSYLLSKNVEQVVLHIGKLEYTTKFKVISIGLLGFRPAVKFDADKANKKYGVGEAFLVAWEKVYQNVSISLKGLSMLFTGLISPKDSLSGPIGIFQYAGMSLEYGWLTYIDFVAKISIALMIMNLLPIPVADGGHLMLYTYEAIAGKPLPQTVILTITKIGFIFLLLVGVLVSINDISRLFN